MTRTLRNGILFAIGTMLLFGIQHRAGLAATPSTSPANLPRDLQGVHRIVCLGDSITQFGQRPGGYVWLPRHYLAAAYPTQHMRVIDAGVAGNTSADMLARYERDVLARNPDTVTINVGINDITRGHGAHFDATAPIPLALFGRNVDRMVCQAQAQHIRVVLIGATVIREDLDNPLNAKVATYNAALEKIARRRSLAYVDCRAAFEKVIQAYQSVTGTRDDFLTVDGIHPNRQGSRIMAHCALTSLGVTPRVQASVQEQVEKSEAAELRKARTLWLGPPSPG